MWLIEVTVVNRDTCRVKLDRIQSGKMKIFGVLFLSLLLLAGFGFYRGWFSMSTGDGNAGGQKTEVNLTVDREKMNADADAVKNQAQKLTGEAREKASDLIEPAGDASRSK